MASPAVKPKASTLTPSGARLMITITVGACAALLLVVPRPVPARELPPLALDPAAIDAALEAEAARAALAPRDEVATRLREQIAARNRAEVGPGEAPEARADRDRALEEAAGAFLERHGEEGLRAVRAEALERLEPALAGALSTEDEEALLGSFPRMLERYGAATEGRVTAPPIVVRALFAARFDAMLGREPAASLSDVERQAYWGFVALGSHAVPAELRGRALREYASANGPGAQEALALAALEAGRELETMSTIEALVAETGDLRLRNLALEARRHFP
ncbi:MAG: hypothetical protein KF901_30725 [Myxococcales bacterium]|nr:hypothetical protein [Myxococcales bacterium]